MTCTRCGREYQPLRRGLCKRCYEHQRKLDGWESSLVDAKPAREHVAALLDAGVSLRQLARLTGINRKVIQSLLRGRSDRGTPPPAKIWPSTAQKLCNVPIPATLLDVFEVTADGALVRHYGTMRRLRALVRIGYPQYDLAQRLGISPSNFGHLINPPQRARSKHRRRARVTAVTARKVRELYRELECTTGPSKSAVTRAKNLGWLPPVVWDEDTIDQPMPWLDQQAARHLT